MASFFVGSGYQSATVLGRRKFSKIDWTLCVVCQQNSNEALKYSLHGPAGSGGKSGPYQSFLPWLCAIRNLELQPMPLSHLTENRAEDHMVSDEAKWQKSFYNKLGMDRLDTAKRKEKDNKKAKYCDKSRTKPISH